MNKSQLRLREIGEFGLIGRIRNWMASSAPGLIEGIGDDVAVIQMDGKILMATTDILIEDIHFDRSWTDPYRLGKKALAVNLSDIAAMGGVPKYYLISVALPKNLPVSYLSAFYRGLRKVGKQFGVYLIGGDTSLSDKIIINICLLGESQKGSILFRKGARTEDDLFVSGTLGDAALGLRMLEKGYRRIPRGLIEKHLTPSPRISLGQAIAQGQLGTAMIDISDGLLIDTNHLLEESNVGARIWEDRLPLSRLYRKWINFCSEDPYAMALCGGEDYELLFTAPPRMREKIYSLARSLRVRISRIGEIRTAKEGFRIVRGDGKQYTPYSLGFDHFRQKKSQHSK